ncbi:craniofacial development protein 2-like [Penaeus vannamei]
MTGRGQEIVELMERRRINITFVQETKWKGCKAKEIGNGFKLFYNGSNGKRNGVGIILNDDIKKGVLSVKRRSDRIIWMKVDLEGEIVNIMSAYAPQMGCDEEEKTQFWEDLEEDLREIPESERLWIGGDFNGHCGSNNRGKEDTIGI